MFKNLTLGTLAKPIGWIITALVLIFFWHPVWQFLGSICAKADGLFK